MSPSLSFLFQILDISYTPSGDSVNIVVHTDFPCHLTVRRTQLPTRIHPLSEYRRGLALMSDVRYCVPAPDDIDQDEPGDTDEHTFPVPDWPQCTTNSFYFFGTRDDVDSPSESCLFTYHNVCPAFGPPVTVIFYTKEGIGADSVDGFVQRGVAGGETWAAIHDALSGTGVNSSYPTADPRLLRLSGGKWRYLIRRYQLFNTSPIPADATILEAILHSYLTAFTNNFPQTPSINVYASNPASNTVLALGDYSKVSAVAFCDTPVFQNQVTPPQWITHLFNSAGKTAVGKGIGGMTKLSVRLCWDADSNPPTATGIQYETQATLITINGTDPLQRPYLEVTYQLPA